ncbi:MAG TPA: ferrochelatase [Tessaracoccus flavescens]|uniref:Coproporphyrin III ferrochelatase n=1 Tax=Tessaracoccus flavescens TaxID=399497 RepID=A0A921ENH9_9ACTN|nr:ferrochelatase [Tessaracoccus flavescens]
MSLAPYTAVLFASYGGPRESADVLPFMRNATAGKGIPDERLVEVSQHYELFGGRSPINELNEALMQAVSEELGRRGVTVPVVIGNRNWTPYLRSTVEGLVDDGHDTVLALATSAYASYSSCRQYCEDLEAAREGLEIRIDKVDPFAEAPEFAAANARALVEAVRTLRHQIGDGALRVLFVTHSVPTAMNEASSTGEPAKRYDAQHLRVAEAVAKAASTELGETLTWELTFCSRSGSPRTPWLEPDVNDRMAELSGEGVEGIVAAPIGFISDHMEVAYDLDTQARETAAEIGLPYQRAATVGTDAGFVSLIVDRLLERAAIARGERPDQSTCQFSTGRCCLPRPVTS